MAASMLLGRRKMISLRDKTVFVTGGSRGLGLLLAQEFAQRGANIAISARDRRELDRAETQLRMITDQVLTLDADMTMREEVELAVHKIEHHFGCLDILVNNAGTICVGPVETMTIDDYRDSINTHFWGPYFATMAVLPSFQRLRRRANRKYILDWRQNWSSSSRSLLRREIRPDMIFRRPAL